MLFLGLENFKIDQRSLNSKLHKNGYSRVSIKRTVLLSVLFKKISKFVDNLFVLFPFEKKYFLPHGIKTTFIGHPLLNNNYQLNTTTNILGFKKNIISIFPGSRRGEIERHLSHILSFISKNNISKISNENLLSSTNYSKSYMFFFWI